MTTQDYEDLQIRAHSRVHQVCHVTIGFHVLCVDLGFHVVIGVGRLTVQREGLKRQLNFTTRNSKYKIIFFWMLYDFVLSSSTQTVYPILTCFTSRKRVL